MSLLLKQVTLGQNITNILIENGVITEISPRDHICDQVLEFNGEIVLPGLVDPHVHVRDLGQQDKEDWTSVSSAALAGGITTIFDMPNTIPPTDNYTHLQLKRKSAAKALVNYKFYLGANNNNLEDLHQILDIRPDDVCGIKIFLAGSSSNDVLSQRDKLAEIFTLAKEYDIVATVHTELQHILDKWKTRYPNPTIMDHNAIRNPEAAILGTKMCLELTAKIGNKLYLAHISTAEEIELIKQYKKDYPIYCEVTPHHLFLNQEVLKNVGNIGKVNPPLRTLKDNEALMQAINDDIIDTVGTDHAPHKLEEKLLNYWEAPSGFSGLETSLALLNKARNSGDLSWEKIIELTSLNCSKIFNLQHAGKIEVDRSADLVIFDPKKEWIINPENFYTKAKYSPWMNQRIIGKVKYTIVGGNVKYKGDDNDK